MAYTDTVPGGFGSSDNPDLSNQWKVDRYNEWKKNNPGGSGSSSSSFTSSTNYGDILKQTQQMFQQSIAPVVSGLQDQSNKVSQAYEQAKQTVESQKEPLKQRYDELIKQLTGQQQVSEQQQTKTTSQEYAKRGVPLSSTIYQQDLTNALNPIGLQYGGLKSEAEYNRQKSLLDLAQQIATLTGQQAGDIGNIQNQIASAQSGILPQASQLALQLLENQQLQEQNSFNGISGGGYIEGQGYVPAETKPSSTSSRPQNAQQNAERLVRATQGSPSVPQNQQQNAERLARAQQYRSEPQYNVPTAVSAMARNLSPIQGFLANAANNLAQLSPTLSKLFGYK